MISEKNINIKESMSNKIRVLSIFDGIGGARQALKELDIDCDYYASEIDKYAITIAKTNHPDITQLGGVRGISTEDGWLFYNQDNNPMVNGGSIKCNFDLLIGGSPCQDLSIAKRDRQGLQGERSGLFYEYVRILNETKPKYFILENVASMSQASRDLISKELGIQPILINSALLTAQQRKRYYWVGKLTNGKYEQINIEQPEDKRIILKDVIEDGFVDRDKSYCVDANYHKGGNPKSYFEKGRRQLVFDKPVRIGCFNKGSQSDRIYSVEGKSICLNANGGGMGAKTGLYAVAQRGRYVNGGGTEQKFKTSLNEKANALTRVQKDSLLLDINNGNYVIRKLTPLECCRLQGFPDNYFLDKERNNIISNTQIYKALGNSFTVPVIKHILKNIINPI